MSGPIAPDGMIEAIGRARDNDAAPNPAVSGVLEELAENPAYGRQWHLHGRAGASRSLVSLNCEAGWRILGSFGSADVVVGIVDDGFLLRDPAFLDASTFVGCARVEARDRVVVYRADADMAALMATGQAHHGDAQCALVAANISRRLPIGVAPNVRIFPIRLVKDGGAVSLSDSVLEQIVAVAAEHCDILLNSWGRSPDMVLSDRLTARIAALATKGGRRGKGVLFIWPSGNGNRPIHLSTSGPVMFSGGVKLRFRRQGRIVDLPTQASTSFRNNLIALPNVLFVGAITSRGQRAHYSCYGTGLHLCAPSNNHHALGLRELEGLGITTCTGWGLDYTDDYKGTSAAAAMVAGVAALGVSARADLSAQDLRQALMQTASKVVDSRGYPPEVFVTKDTAERYDLGPIAPFENGAFDADGWSPWFGFGTCDAAALTTFLLDGVAPRTTRS
jgi:subtilisin family serine protease